MELHQPLRERLRAIVDADQSSATLSDADHTRIAQRTAERGPAIIRRARMRSAGIRYVLVPGAVLLTVALLWRTPDEPSVAKAPSLPAKLAAAADGPTTQSCASRDVQNVAEARFVATGSHRSILDLGSLAVAVAGRGASARLLDSRPCKTVFVLDRGRLTVHARNLEGGELRVRAGQMSVVVHGTIFTTTIKDASLIVEVLEGEVAVERPGAPSERVRSGERVTLYESRVVREALTSTARRTIRSELDVLSGPPTPYEEASAVVVHPKNRSEDSIVARAEARRRRGNLQGARVLYQEAGHGHGSTAEAAWLALARMEIGVGRQGAARAALAEHERRFRDGTLGLEGAWLRLKLEQKAGNDSAARAAAKRLITRWPASPQAKVAREVIGSRP